MEFKIITFKTKKEYKKIIKKLKQKGYNWVNGKDTSFETIKNTLPKQTRTFALCFYYNSINKKYEIQYQTLSFYKRQNKTYKNAFNNKVVQTL